MSGFLISVAQFFGEEKINQIISLGDGTGETKVELKNGQTYTLPDSVLDKMITKEKVDWRGASVNDYMLGVISEDLIALLRDHYKLNCKALERLCMFMQNKSANDFNVAQQLLWGKGIYDVKLLDVQDVLQKGAGDKKKEAQSHADAFSAERAARKN